MLPFLLAGTPDCQTALRLHCTERSVRVRSAAILRKFGVRSRDQLIALLG